MIYPKTRQENIEFRAKIFMADEKIRSMARELAFKDILFFFNVFAWTYGVDVERGGTEKHPLPFITYLFQDDAILKIVDAIEQGENLFIEKTRDVGVTWMILTVFDWFWLKGGGSNFRIGSRKEDYVDKAGDMDTHFEKIRFQLARLPGWMLPKGFDLKKHCPYMRLINPENGNAIIGEATNKDFGRGGRQRACLFDEFPVWEFQEEAWRSASDATKSKIAVGTPEGAGNKFAELSRTTEVKRKLRLHWSQHPLKTGTSEKHLEKVSRREVFDVVGGYVVEVGKDQTTAPPGCYVDQYGKLRSEWYDNEHERRDRDNVASNLDIDYLTTGRPIFDTMKCDLRLREAKSGERGDLMWKVRPIFSSDGGYCINQNQLEVEFVKNVNGIYEVWQHPREDFDNGYVIGADTAEGLEQGDYDSAYCDFRGEDKLKTVASLHGKFKIHEYAEELAKFGVYYKRAYVNIERNNHGHGVIQQTMKFYNQLWHKDLFTRGYAELTDQIGFSTTTISKPVIIGTLGKAISNEEFVCDDAGFWKETLTFVEDDGRMEAQGKSRGQKCYDDRVMAKAITLWTHLNMPLPSMKRKQEQLVGWRKSWEQKLGNLVGWVVPSSMPRRIGDGRSSY